MTNRQALLWRISIDAALCFGWPVIRGTRIRIFMWMGEGWLALLDERSGRHALSSCAPGVPPNRTG
jgi:hypothetical protein